jgi:hypothetical protein
MFSLSNSPDRLDIRHLPLHRWIGGVISMMVGLAFIVGARVHTIECTRGVECRYTHARLIDGMERVFAVEELRGAHMEITRDFRSRYVHRVYLNIAGESVFMYTESGQKSHDDVTRAVNAFVDDSNQASLRAVKDDRPLMVSFGLLSLVFAAVIGLVFAPIVYASLDARTGYLTIRRRTLFRDFTEMHPLDELRSVYVESRDVKIRDYRYRVIFVMTGGMEVPLTAFPSSFRKPKDNVVRAVEQFLTRNRQGGRG